MTNSGHHPKKEIADVLRLARSAGFVVREIHRGHRWGEVICTPCQSNRSVYSTPRDPSSHAKQIDRFIRAHTHRLPSGTRTVF